MQRQALFEFVYQGDGFALCAGGFGGMFGHHGQSRTIGDQVDNGLRIIADDLLFGRQLVAVPELL